MDTVQQLSARLELSPMDLELHQRMTQALDRRGGHQGRSAASWIEQLMKHSTPDGGVLDEASLEAIVHMGPCAVVPLIDALHHHEEHAQKIAIRALGALGATARAASPELVKMLFTSEPDNIVEHSRAWEAKAALKALGEDAIPSIVQAYEEETDGWRIVVADLLDEIGTAVLPFLVHSLGHPSPRTGHATVGLLKRFGASALPYLIELLESDDPRLQEYVPQAISGLGQAAISAIPALVDFYARKHESGPEWMLECMWCQLSEIGSVEAIIPVLQHPDPQIRGALVRALQEMDADLPESAVPALCSLLTHDDRDTRSAVSDMLYTYLSSAKNVDFETYGPMLMQLIRNDDECIRDAVAWVLHILPAPGEQRLQDLIALLQHEPTAEGVYAASCLLAKMGPSARSAVPSLVAAIPHTHYGNGDGFWAFLEALSALLKPHEVVQTLVQALTNHPDNVDDISEALAELDAIPQLFSMLSSESAAERRVGLQALASVSSAMLEDCPRAMEQLSLLLDDACESTRCAAAVVLARFGSKAASFISSDTPEAHWAWAVLHPNHRASITVLLNALTHSNPHVRRLSEATLPSLGSGLIPFQVQLGALLKGRNTDTVYTALRLIKQLGPQARSILPEVESVIANPSHPIGLRTEALETTLVLTQDAPQHSVPVLIGALRADKPALAEAAASALGGLSRQHAGTALPALEWVIRESTLPEWRYAAGHDARRACLRLVVRLQRNPVKLAVALVRALRGPMTHDEVLHNHIIRMGRMAVPALIALLENTEPSMQWENICKVLSAMGPQAADALDALRRALHANVEGSLKWYAAAAIAAVYPGSRRASCDPRPDLIQALDGRNFPTCSSIAFALDTLGPSRSSHKELDALLQQWHSTDLNYDRTLFDVTQGFVIRHGERALKPLSVAYLNTTDTDVRLKILGTVQAIEKPRRIAREVLPMLRHALSCDELRVRGLEAISALGGPAALVTDVAGLLNSAQGTTQEAAARALRALERPEDGLNQAY